MPILPFESRHGYSVGATAVVDSLRNINAVGGTYTARVSMAGGVTASQLFVGGTITAGTVSATTYRNLPVANSSGGITGVMAPDGTYLNGNAAGIVSITNNVATTVLNQTLSGYNTFSAGLSTASLFVGGGGITLNSRATFVSGLTSLATIATHSLSVDQGLTVGTVSATTYRNLPIATTSTTGVASFSSTFFKISSGAVSLNDSYAVTGDTIVGGTNIGTSRSGNIVTVSSTHPLASASATGVASFNTNDFTVTTGAVSLSNVARTNAANTFTSAQTFNAGITTQSAFVSQGLTVGGRAAFNSGITSANLFVGAGTTLNSSLYVGGNSRLGGTTANTITLPNGQVIKTYFATSVATSTYSLITEPMSIFGDMQSADILIHAETYGDDPATPGTEFGTFGVQNLRISVVALSSEVKHVQYGNVFVGQTAASFDVDLSGGEWRLRVTPNTARQTAVRAQAILSPNIGNPA